MSRKESITAPNRVTYNIGHVVKREKRAIPLEKMRAQKMRSPTSAQL